MSGFMKKANQFMSEKLGGVEPTKLNDDLVNLKQKTSVINSMVEDVLTKTKEYLQPNPALRAMAAASKFSKGKNPAPPIQPEGVLAETMLKYGNELGTELVLGKALVKMGESVRVLAEEKNALDTGMRQEFFEPFTRFQNTELKEITHYRKKLHDARVDYDYKKRKLEKTSSFANREELKISEEKLEEFVNLTHMRMHNLLENEVEQVTQLSTLASQLYDYHQHCSEILRHLMSNMHELKLEAADKPKTKYETYTLEDMGIIRVGESSAAKYSSSGSMNTATATGYNTSNLAPKPMSSAPPSPKPSFEQYCRALYDFESLNDKELSFKEGDEITIIKRIDENWYEGRLYGRSGFFPSNHVQIL